MFDKILKSSAKKICVIAAPGSGKTKRALIPKVVQVLADQAVDPKNVLLLTFSRLSAKDLKERVSKMQRAPRASTLHSLCLAFLLSEDGHGMRKRVESIVLDFEKDALLSDLKLVFPRKTKPQLKNMLAAFSVGWATKPHDGVFEEDEEKRSFKAAIVGWLSEHEAAMMEEIVYGAVDLARQLGTTEFIQAPQHIFIDEYQDLNRLEQEFVNLLAAESKLLFVVGDPDQSIYGSFKYSYPNGIKEYAAAPDVEAYSSYKTGRCPGKIAAIANQLLLQADPSRTHLLESTLDDEGEVHFVQKENQTEEFAYILRSIAERLSVGALPENIIVLVPKKPLGVQFVEYAKANRGQVGVPSGTQFKFDSKVKLTKTEQERMLLFGLAVKPDSLLHIRGYLALDDANAHAAEIKTLKNKYGNLAQVLQLANPEDFSRTQRRVRSLCARIIELRALLTSSRDSDTVDVVIDRLFPIDDDATRTTRVILDELREDDDTLHALYSKLVDHMRTIPTSSTDVRVMTLMGSKGLEANHVYILGCNAGNIPGSNRSHLSEHEHKEEQRRLLFVGVTRASKSLTISWARYIPFAQSRRHHTQGLHPIRRQGQQSEMVMGKSEFLQDLTGILWEN